MSSCINIRRTEFNSRKRNKKNYVSYFEILAPPLVVVYQSWVVHIALILLAQFRSTTRNYKAREIPAYVSSYLSLVRHPVSTPHISSCFLSAHSTQEQLSNLLSNHKNISVPHPYPLKIGKKYQLLLPTESKRNQIICQAKGN